MNSRWNREGGRRSHDEEVTGQVVHIADHVRRVTWVEPIDESLGAQPLSPPITLDETYEKTLQCIPKEQTQEAHRLFQCLIAAIRPLRVEELAEIFAIQFDSNEGPSLVEDWRPKDPEDAVLTACSCLIAIVDVEDSKIVQFSHFSVKEFLTSDRLAASNDGNISRYHIPLGPAHTILVQACLTVLLQLDHRTDKTRLGTFPLAFYAAQHWVDHAKFGSVASEVGDAMERLFDPKKLHVAAWTWIHDRYKDKYRKSMDKLDEHPSSTEATPLYYAVLCGFTELAKQLIITHAEDVNAQCWHGTPLYGAFRGGQLECMRLLLEHGADTEARIVHDSVLHLASKGGQVEVVRLLLQHNADVNPRGYTHQTPLHDASGLGQFKVAQLLLEYGADVNAQCRDRSTPLLFATKIGHLELVRLLLGHGADVHIRETSRTLFHWATVIGCHEIAQLLLEYGARQY
ncbi:ankyrin repeat-containing domain protein [Lactifluus subvellereus]|nr:ankyrin repeat-containing domain protein [Lactifluus subvellereus]